MCLLHMKTIVLYTNWQSLRAKKHRNDEGKMARINTLALMQSLVWLMLKTESEIIGAKNLFSALTFFSPDFPPFLRRNFFVFSFSFVPHNWFWICFIFKFEMKDKYLRFFNYNSIFYQFNQVNCKMKFLFVYAECV